MHQTKHTLLLGAHMSTAGGLEQAIIRGESIGCSAIQLFTKNNRQWHAKELSTEEIDLFKNTVAASSIQKEYIVAHATYLINMGATQPEIAQKSVAALAQELRRCESLHIPYLVLHPGSGQTSDDSSGLDRIINNMDTALQQAQGKTMLLLETMAGQGNSLCYKLEHLAYIRQKSRFTERLGVCVDTCHIFAAGYDVRTEEAYQNFWQTFEQIVGIDTLKVIHVNDSKKELGTRVDRHEDIGKGKIGSVGFELLFNDKRFFDIPKIVETPKDTIEDDARNMSAIKNLLSIETKQLYGIV